jgi:hypothetical protein
MAQDPALDDDQASQSTSCSGGNHVLQAPASSLNNQNIRFDACVSLVKAQQGSFDPTAAVARVVARHADTRAEVVMGSAVLGESSFAGFASCWNNPTAKDCFFNFFNFQPLPSGSWQLELRLDRHGTANYEVLATTDVNVVTALTSVDLVAGPEICQAIGGTEPPFSCNEPLTAAPGSEVFLPVGDTDYFVLVRFKVSGTPIITASTVGLSPIQGTYSERFFPWGKESHVQAWFHSYSLAQGVSFNTSFSTSGAGAEPQHWPAPAVRTAGSN